ncbi:MAG: hypothetical protein VYC39_05525 [Myxococcota bacterium]|nr:hypothetical protein [Myxococcota bacterium]
MWTTGFLLFVAQLSADTSTATTLEAQLAIRPTILDYELPGHPNTLGRGHVGVISEATLRYTPNPYVLIGAGVIGRLAFALEQDEYAQALPIFYAEARPTGMKHFFMRFGTLRMQHGYHPAVIDEARHQISRNIAETYNRSIPTEARRSSVPRQALPLEHGAQIVYQKSGFRGEMFLDWQLLETDDPREKFNFGILAEYDQKWMKANLQFRLTHYGGQLFTQGDPIRFAQLDPVRQPETMAVVIHGRPVVLQNFVFELVAGAIAGHMIQEPLQAEEWHYGIEVGAQLKLYSSLELGYRYWFPRDSKAGFVSEDSEPTYNQGTSHKLMIGLNQNIGGIKIDGSLSLVVPEDNPDKIQYLAVTRVSYDIFYSLF